MLQFTTGMNEKHWATSCVLHTFVSWQKEKQYMACWVLTTWQSSRKQDSHEKKKQIKVRVKSIQRVDVLLCAPRVSPIWWTSTANGDRNARVLETGRSQDHRPDFVRVACNGSLFSVCLLYAVGRTRTNTHTDDGKDPRKPLGEWLSPPVLLLQAESVQKSQELFLQ